MPTIKQLTRYKSIIYKYQNTALGAGGRGFESRYPDERSDFIGNQAFFL